MNLDPAHLRSFLAIVRFGGYHRAGDALHLTQPAISRHMRRLEEQLGEPLFVRQGRGVELTPYGERAATEFGRVLAVHDQALATLARTGSGDGPFVLGTIENLVDPVLPKLLAVVREQIGGRPLQLRVDRSAELAAGFRRGEIDAAIVLDHAGVTDALELGPLTLRWWTDAAAAVPDTPPDPLPLVAYDPPCSLRDLALARIHELDLQPLVMAESPHLSGVHAAARNGLGYALLASGADGLRAVSRGPLAEPIEASLSLLVGAGHAQLARPLRAVLGRVAQPLVSAA